MTVPLPPLWVRRLLIDPLFFVVVSIFLLVGDMLLIILIVVLPFVANGSLRALRLLGFALIYLTLEVVGLAVLFGSWVVSGFGWAQRRPAFVRFHYRVLASMLGVLHWFARRYFVLRIEGEGPEVAGDDGQGPAHPLLVLSRHAGPGDSFLLVQELLVANCRPRIVLKYTLQLDPVVDVLFNRLPMAFIDPRAAGSQGSIAAIGDLARTMGPGDALLIFPEGGNVTPKRRTLSIKRLRESGREQAARRAEGIVNLLPPRPGGVKAALVANPDVQVVVVAHTGLDDLNSVADLWDAIPVDKTLHLRWHEIPGAEVPTDLPELSTWLFDEWEQIDRWVDVQRADGPSGTG